ncbi:class II glutamine amidotransferase [Nocardia shimofusensis]|uniref:class II glutamine amidotransferase n=1 Tax=Nocardia shimofusensis TaxID=228596 RepID=UPI000A62052A|nr:class II glutamine amidotransferase [Nocardia shimofusensis]
MCLLTYYPPTVVPDPIALFYGAGANPHGHGYAVLTGTEIIVGHGMAAESVIEEFVAVRARHRHGAALFHSRYATQGARELGNCHPFPLGGDRRTVLAHNGTLPKRVHPRAYDPRSDTRIAAEDYLPGSPFGSIDTRRGARGLSQWLGRSKLVILTVDPAYQQQAYVFGEQAGIWEDGIWYSNTSYLPPARRWPGKYRYLCGYCWRFDVYRTSRYCGDCGWCFACRTPVPDCSCRPPRPCEPGADISGPTVGRHRHAAVSSLTRP